MSDPYSEAKIEVLRLECDAALAREAKLRAALSELMGNGHNLKAAFSLVRRWGDDPVFVDKAQREQECARIEQFVNEWHSILCAALKAAPKETK